MGTAAEAALDFSSRGMRVRAPGRSWLLLATAGVRLLPQGPRCAAGARPVCGFWRARHGRGR
eukprot:4960647-Pleurochrysis_carterae.AAC.1